MFYIEWWRTKFDFTNLHFTKDWREHCDYNTHEKTRFKHLMELAEVASTVLPIRKIVRGGWCCNNINAKMNNARLYRMTCVFKLKSYKLVQLDKRSKDGIIKWHWYAAHAVAKLPLQLLSLHSELPLSSIWFFA